MRSSILIFEDPTLSEGENANVTMQELNEWVAENRLLDAVLELEHPNEHAIAREVTQNVNATTEGGNEKKEEEEKIEGTSKNWKIENVV